MSVCQSLPYFLGQFVRDYEYDMCETHKRVTDSLPDCHARILRILLKIIDKKPNYLLDHIRQNNTNGNHNHDNGNQFLASPIRTFNDLNNSNELIDCQVCPFSSLLKFDDIYEFLNDLKNDVICYWGYNHNQFNLTQFIDYFFRCLKYEIEQTRERFDQMKMNETNDNCKIKQSQTTQRCYQSEFETIDNSGPYSRKHDLRDEIPRALEDCKRLRFELIGNNSNQESWIKLLVLRDIIRECLIRMPRQYISQILFDKKHQSIIAIRRVYNNNTNNNNTNCDKVSKSPSVMNHQSKSASISPTIITEYESKWDDLIQGNVDGFYVMPQKNENFIEFVFGGLCFRPFVERNFAEVVFLAIQSRQQIQGFGTRIMNHLKETLKSMNIFNILTYADNNAIEYFTKQGFHKCDEKYMQCCLKYLNPILFQNYIKHYDDATLMHCKLLYHHKYHLMTPNNGNNTANSNNNFDLNYCYLRESLDNQRKFLISKLKLVSKSHERRNGIKFYYNEYDGKVMPIELNDIPGLMDSSWINGNNKMKTNLHRLRVGKKTSMQLDAELCIVMKHLWLSRQAEFFRNPVNIENAPDYYNVITDPIDLSYMKTKLANGDYLTHKQFEKDFRLMINNCKLFNPSKSKWVRKAVKLEQLFNNLWQHN